MCVLSLQVNISVVCSRLLQYDYYTYTSGGGVWRPTDQPITTECVCVVIAPLAGDQTCFKPRPELKCSYFWPELEPTRLRVGKSTAAGEWCLKTVPTVELSPHTDSRQGSTTDQGDVCV